MFTLLAWELWAGTGRSYMASMSPSVDISTKLYVKFLHIAPLTHHLDFYGMTRSEDTFSHFRENSE